MVYFEDFGNFSNDWTFGEFPKTPGIWEISQIPGYLEKFPKILKIHHSQIPTGIWGISQMLGYLGNFPNTWVSGKFKKM